MLQKEQELLLKRERQLMSELQMALVKLDAEPADQEALRQSIQQLDELFLLVVVG